MSLSLNVSIEENISDVDDDDWEIDSDSPNKKGKSQFGSKEKKGVNSDAFFRKTGLRNEKDKELFSNFSLYNRTPVRLDDENKKVEEVRLAEWLPSSATHFEIREWVPTRKPPITKQKFGHRIKFGCKQCGASETPERRRGPSGKVDLCNACGLQYRKTKDNSSEENLERIKIKNLLN